MARRNRKPQRRSPLWTRLCLIIGIVLTLGSGSAYAGTVVLSNRLDHAVQQRDLLGDGSAHRSRTVTGPLDILLAGSDLRSSWKRTGELPRADTIMWLHVSASLDRAYLLSIPRDLEVHIPADARTGKGDSTTKINAAFPYGMRDVDDTTGGMRLLTTTVQQVTGAHFGLAALADWDGFKDITSELGGVRLCVDKTFVSRQPGLPREKFTAGCHHYDATRALQLVRQRYAYADSDYGRQRMQQQYLRQILTRATSTGVLTNPVKLNRLLDATSRALTMDLNGYRLADLALALRRLTPAKVVGLQIAHRTLPDGNESLVQPVDDQLFAALRDDTIGRYLARHPTLVSHGPGAGD
ncbi:LCP family protein [Actinocatenispora sera]|uniref:LCP family protein n=1 Tax=Actinocatenispora sera TaxID=390989 RepID=UPI0033EEB22C